MDEFPVDEHRPNVNSATIAGEVASVERGPGQTPHLAFVVKYHKTWPQGGTTTVPLRGVVTGRRVTDLAWLQPGMWIVVHGELTADGAVYGLQVERMAAARRRPA